MDDLTPGRNVGELLLPDASVARQAELAVEHSDPTLWADRVRRALVRQSDTALGIAEEALRACPGEFELLLLAALAALVAGQPVRAHAFLKRHQKRYVPGKSVALLTALAFAQQRQFSPRLGDAVRRRDRDLSDLPLAGSSARRSCRAGCRSDCWKSASSRHRSATRVEDAFDPAASPAKPPASRPQRASVAPAAPTVAVPDLPRLDASFDMQVEIANPQAIELDGAATDPGWFRLRGELIRLSLFEGFDELLCLPALRGVETHWYQVETVRKVLKQYRGRVLLADEVGLGKTIEAGMVLKEYMLRGMAERRADPDAGVAGRAVAGRDGRPSSASTAPPATTRCCAATRQRFWAQPRVIASIAARATQGACRAARRPAATTWSWSTRRTTCATSRAPATGW